MTFWLIIVIEHIVNYEIKAGAQIGHVTTEGPIGIDGDFEAIQVDAIVGREERLQVCVFIALYLLGWKALRLEVLESLVAHGIHRLRCMIHDYLPSLPVEVYILLFAIHL